ncbi:hypothetical protein BH24ACT22_BH24ACT22_09300 [soil metagenome]
MFCLCVRVNYTENRGMSYVELIGFNSKMIA